MKISKYTSDHAFATASNPTDNCIYLLYSQYHAKFTIAKSHFYILEWWSISQKGIAKIQDHYRLTVDSLVKPVQAATPTEFGTMIARLFIISKGVTYANEPSRLLNWL